MSGTNKIIVSGDALAAAMKTALTSKGYTTPAGVFVPFVTSPGECEKFMREVVQSLYGDLFDFYWGPSAYATMLRFQRDGKYSLPASTLLQAGDIIFKGVKTSGPAGHTAMWIPAGVFGENSSYHWLPESDNPDARGTRSKAAMGLYECVVRLSIYTKGKPKANE